MVDSEHLRDFQERLSQLTEPEAVKEAYLAYTSLSFSGYTLSKTPPALAKRGVQLSEDPRDLTLLGLSAPFDACLYDELVCIAGRRGSLGWELAAWLEKPRALTLDRLQRLWLLPSTEALSPLPNQTDFHRRLQELTHQDSTQFVGLLIAVSPSDGLDEVLRSELPLQAKAFTFTDSILAALIPDSRELLCRWSAHKATEGLRKVLQQLNEPQRPVASVACWPDDVDSVPMMMLVLQQGLQDAKRLDELPGSNPPTIVYASQWFRLPNPDDSTGPETLASRLPPDPHLSGGHARKLEDESV